MSPLALAPEEITASFRDALGEGVESTSTFQGQASVLVSPDAWIAAFTHARDDLGCDFFSFVSAIDWVGEEAENDPGEDAEASTGADEASSGRDEETGAGEDTYRPPSGALLQVVGRITSTAQHHGVTLKANLPKSDPSISTLVGVYEGANWHEREMMEMFGIVVEGHPDPRKIYLTDEFEGHPLLKSFKLGAREVKPWPGDVDVEDMPDDAPVLDDEGNVVEVAVAEGSDSADPEGGED
ncbi:MAG: NADH-quinone oxidoreductase subunit C [Actinobacteria bacterium ATB1]|nr:NADH-quinone oxidoreductase subunit C [Actinobacteria bacterium ATB1]